VKNIYERLADRFHSRRWFQEHQELRLFQVSSMAVIIIFVALMAKTGWYQSVDNVNGIAVEIHGAIFEVLLLSVLFESYLRKKENISNIDINNVLHSRIYDLSTNNLSKLAFNYTSGEKYYVYFGERMSIARVYEILDYIGMSDTDKFVLAEITGYKKLNKDFIDVLQDVLREIHSIYVTFADHIDREIMIYLLESEEACSQIINNQDASLIGGKDAKEHSIDELLQANNAIVFSLIKLKQTLEIRASKIESREDHSEAMKNKHQKLEEMRKALSNVQPGGGTQSAR